MKRRKFLKGLAVAGVVGVAAPAILIEGKKETPPIRGFEVEDIGSLPFYRTRLDWYGNFITYNPYKWPPGP